jgi:phosphoglycolate phosphatase
MQNKVAIFDFDGTLFFDTFNLNKYAMNKALEKHNLHALSEGELIQTVGDTLPDIVKRLLKTDEAQVVNDFCKQILLYAVEYINEYASFKPAVIEMIKKLYANRIKVCICSNGAKQYIYAILKRFNLVEYFETIWYAKTGISKSDAVKLIKQKYNVNKCFMIGDREEDILAGKANDCITIGIVGDYDDFSVKGAENFDISDADYLTISHKNVLTIILNEYK